MKTVLKFIGVGLLAAFIIALGYYSFVVFEARRYTRNTVLKDTQKSQWRPFDGSPIRFDITGNELSGRQKDILIKVQDPGFYTHHGIDLTTPGNGLTTITQAIAKKLYFNNFTPGIAKIKQSVIARFVVDELVPKEDQLTLFLNSMYFGTVNHESLIGLVSAARAYYQRPVRDLSEDQFISLIAMLVAPSTFHILDHPEWNKERVERIRLLVNGKYVPKGLMDQYYGNLPGDVVKAGLPPASYFETSK